MAARWRQPARRHEGAIQPMEDGLPSNGTIAAAVLAAIAVIAFTWLGIPALVEWSIAMAPAEAVSAEIPVAP